MIRKPTICQRLRSLSGYGFLLFGGTFAAWGADPGSMRVTNAVVLSIANQVEVARYGAQAWDPAYVQPRNQVLDPGDRLRTGRDSRALLRLSNLTDFPIGELTQLEIPREKKARTVVRVLKGVIYFFHRDRPGEFQVDTPTVSAVVRGTEFNLEVAEDGTSTFRVLDGQLEMSNEFGNLHLLNGQEGVSAPGKPPIQTAVIMTSLPNTIQWCLYYPGILYLDELRLGAEEQRALASSLNAYRSGDLVEALAKYPVGRQQASDHEKVYRAALLLAVGKVSESEKLIDALTEPDAKSLGQALQTVIAAVKFAPPITSSPLSILHPPSSLPPSPSAWLAESYAQQAQFHLEAALGAARRAAEMAPDFAFAWTKVAELEFGFGRTKAALAALEKSLRLAPRNAQSLALKAFLLAARNRTVEAIGVFDQAILADGALGNAWLGRGLCRIRRGETEAGRRDLLVAATLEPQRAVLRSYLGKAFGDAGDPGRALPELDLARGLDPNDPTAWLYSALIKQQENRINEAVSDLEKSAEQHAHRQVYRSRLLLDEDRAVRGANLAGVYQDAGMTDVSLREAARAVNTDYANYSAHLFLGASYNALRDPRGVNLRYETPWLSEYLVANLLAPVAAGTLSPAVTQQEYARLFERNRLGLVSGTEYRSSGAWEQSTVHYGILDNFSYTLEGAYRSENGSRPNNDLELLTVTAKVKEQLTPEDSLFFQTTWFAAESGDLAQYYYQSKARTGLRVKEAQEPLLMAGWHHEWNPGSHTLFFAGYWRDTLQTSDPAQPMLFLLSGGSGRIVGVPDTNTPPTTANANYQSHFDGWTAELQHIWQAGNHTVVVGSRVQGGEFDTRSELSESTPTGFLNTFTITTDRGFTNSVKSNLGRLSLYAYENWRIMEPILLTAGVSYDRLQAPVNFRSPPVVDNQETVEQVSPKAGIIWTPAKHTTVRGAYTRSLGGVSFDQSFRLEPSQVAGFNQAFRGLIPDSVSGSPAGARFETGALSVEQKLGHGTYLGAQGEWLHESGKNHVGDVELVSFFPFQTAQNTLRQNLDYEERNLILTVNQLVGKNWSFGARYRLSDANLESDLPAIPATLSTAAHSDVSATLHQVNLFVLFNHQSGFFGQTDSVWLHQSNRGYTCSLPGEDLWQFNLLVGYRFPHRRMEARLGLLNLTGQDYRLNPLNLLSELPRERTLVASLRFSF